MIRNATHDDIPAMVSLGQVMHGESPRYRNHPMNTEKVAALIRTLIDSDDGLAIVAERDGEMLGGFIGMAFDHWSVDAKTSTDFALFVRQDRRGGLIGIQLLRRYVEWAREKGVPDEFIDCGITTGVTMEASAKLYQISGFEPTGYLFSYKGT